MQIMILTHYNNKMLCKIEQEKEITSISYLLLPALDDSCADISSPFKSIRNKDEVLLAVYGYHCINTETKTHL